MKIVRLKPLKMPKKKAVKAKDSIKSAPVSNTPRPLKIHGHTTIVLTDPKTGKQEVHEDDNMMTSAMREFFQNCGFLNYPNATLSELVPQLLGGIMGFDVTIDDTVDAQGNSITKVPKGAKMIFNGSMDNTQLVSDVSELGTYVTSQSGWQQNGSFVQTYDYSMEQGNGTISCVCLAGRDYAYAGEGNTTSKVRCATKKNIATLGGSVTSISGISGYIFNIDLADSSCKAFSMETVEGTTTGYLRTYRLPISKLALNGTMTAPVLIDETTVTLDEQIVTAMGDGSSTFLQAQAFGDNLYLWNCHASTNVWGTNWTQYLWTLTPSGTLSKVTLSNTSGVELPGLQMAIIDGTYIFFVKARGMGYGTWSNLLVDSTKVYALKIADGSIVEIDNPYGFLDNQSMTGNWTTHRPNVGFNLLHGSGDGRIVTTGNYPFVCDVAVTEGQNTGACYPTNAASNTYGNLAPVDKLIRSIGANLYRDQGYIATINNLATPVVKDNTRTMRVIYRLTFEEEEENE